ncbi:MAG: hypothetical protein AB7L13_00400 [Acidimicrobiia bacterium]
MRRCRRCRVLGLVVVLSACGAPVPTSTDVTTSGPPSSASTTAVSPTTTNAPTTTAAPTTAASTTTTVPVVPADPTDEAFGALARGIAASAAEALFGAPSTTTTAQFEGGTADWVSHWRWPAIGLDLRIVSEELGGPQRVDGITVSAPFPLRTTRGIGIGSSRQDVKAAYAEALSRPLWDMPAETTDGILVGTPYGGTYFALEHDLVVRIFVGASAE